MPVRWLKSFAGEQGFFRQGVPTDVLRGKNIVLGVFPVSCSFVCESERLGYPPPFFHLPYRKHSGVGGHLNFSWPSTGGKRSSWRLQGTHQSLSEFVEHGILFGLYFT